MSGAEGAAYLSEAVSAPRIAESTAAVLDGIASAYEQLITEGFESLRAEYESRSVLTGRPVVISDLSGAVRASGEALGVDDVGRLLVVDGEGVRAVASGEVTLRGSAL